MSSPSLSLPRAPACSRAISLPRRRPELVALLALGGPPPGGVAGGTAPGAPGGGMSGGSSQALAEAVAYAEANGGGRVAEQVGTPVGQVDGLYDLQGLADALRDFAG